MSKTLSIAALLLSAFLFAGCDNDGPLEEAGEKADDVANDIGNAVEDACEDAKDAVNAKDEDC